MWVRTDGKDEKLDKFSRLGYFMYLLIDIFDELVQVLEILTSIFKLEIRAHSHHYVVCREMFSLQINQRY